MDHHNSPSGFHVRDATLTDVEDLTRLWYSSFNTSHRFWDVMTPDDPVTHQWWNDVWTIGVKAGANILKTFVVEDLSQENKLVAFARWNLPQADGTQDIPLPAYPSHWDADLTEALWGGMPRNRAAVMGQQPHWMLEFLGVDHAYQHKGLGFSLVDWGCRQADAAGLDVYLDATIKGLPFYKKYFGFQDRKLLSIPSHPETFGNYHLMAVVRPAQVLPPVISGDEKHAVGTSAIEIVELA
ncbi:acyl-CoA N-acyltransferase [Pseudomassariella vexata]|uniref:Acyl-CoA N-acyltransferase n=1 Tax=Pseudomassariella vexata TaxID=1141098 RepID=A0A1Y2DLF5_9PEZI|nr:acyl-CoA N-acyltransferase [Pseudomassariella vexata]ORY60061.1 acyl-CoA N-acyltransferase [Pseudomassariella vexata]